MNPHYNPRVKFREVQQFRQVWLWVLLLIMILFVALLFGYGMIQQLIFGEAWGNRPLSDSALAITGTATILFTTSLTYLLYTLKLITEVRDDGLYVRFFPLAQRKIPFSDIAACEVRTYRPIRDYGGWGIKYGRKGKAYNVSGNQGVQLEFKEGKPLLIGSQRPEELAGAIKERLRLQN